MLWYLYLFVHARVDCVIFTWWLGWMKETRTVDLCRSECWCDTRAWWRSWNRCQWCILAKFSNNFFFPHTMLPPISKFAWPKYKSKLGGYRGVMHVAWNVEILKGQRLFKNLNIWVLDALSGDYCALVSISLNFSLYIVIIVNSKHWDQFQIISNWGW